MRMIDADALDKTFVEAQAECKKNGGNFRFGVLSNVRANIANAPTIPAIPVDWLEEQRDKRRVAAAAHSNISSMTVLEAINVVLELWEKEG